jgi:hypothetical protein
MVQIEEADIHVQIASVIEAWQTQRNPILTTTSLDTPGFEKHVEDKLQITGVQAVLLRTYYWDQLAWSHYKPIEQVLRTGFEKSVIDGGTERFGQFQTFESREQRGRWPASEAISQGREECVGALERTAEVVVGTGGKHALHAGEGESRQDLHVQGF